MGKLVGAGLLLGCSAMASADGNSGYMCVCGLLFIFFRSTIEARGGGEKKKKAHSILGQYRGYIVYM